MKIKKLFENKWVSVNEIKTENGGTYVYSTNPWCGGEGVAILPYTRKDGLKFLARYEVCPAHSNQIERCSITGGMDKKGESPVFTARRELIEEAGYDVPADEFVYLGTVKPSKASDTTTHLFSVSLDGDKVKKVQASGDGTLCEEGAYCDFVNVADLSESKDPLLHAMITRMIGRGVL